MKLHLSPTTKKPIWKCKAGKFQKARHDSGKHLQRDMFVSISTQAYRTEQKAFHGQRKASHEIQTCSYYCFQCQTKKVATTLLRPLLGVGQSLIQTVNKEVSVLRKFSDNKIRNWKVCEPKWCFTEKPNLISQQWSINILLYQSFQTKHFTPLDHGIDQNLSALCHNAFGFKKGLCLFTTLQEAEPAVIKTMALNDAMEES